MKVTLDIPPPPFHEDDTGIVTQDWQYKGQSGKVKKVYFDEVRLEFSDITGELTLEKGYWKAIVVLEDGHEGHYSAIQFKVIE